MARLATVDAIDVTDLASELADYHTGNQKEIYMNLFYSKKWMERFRVIDKIKDREPLFPLDIDLELVPQADYKAFAEQNNVFKVGNRYMQTHEVKLDLLIVPRELSRSYFAYAYKEGTDNFDMGITEFFFQYLNEKVQEKMHLNAFYGGVRSDIGTTTAATMDGMLKVVADEITAGNLSPVVTGIVTAANVITAIEAVCDAHEDFPAWADVPKQVVVNPTIFNWYWQKRRELYPNLIQSYAGNIGYITELPIEGFNATLVKEPGLGASQRIISTPKDNKVLGFDSTSDWNNMIFQPFNRTLKVMMDFKCGFNFSALYEGSTIVNDQA